MHRRLKPQQIASVIIFHNWNLVVVTPESALRFRNCVMFYSGVNIMAEAAVTGLTNFQSGSIAARHLAWASISIIPYKNIMPGAFKFAPVRMPEKSPVIDYKLNIR